MPRLLISERGSFDTSRQLRAMGVRATRQKPTMRAAGRDASRRVRGVPVRTGKLKASVDLLEVTETGFVVGSTVPYAPYVFHGTKTMAARPPDVPSDIGARTAYAVGHSVVH